MSWDPAVYGRFSDHRLRPALDLLARVPEQVAASVADLGCGSGAATALLRHRWPGARIIGVDSSRPMLDEARARHVEDPQLAWVEADIGSWDPDHDLDLIFANASLHWLDDHRALFPRLMGHLRPGGTLAVQMPANFGQPTHTSIAQVVHAHRWSHDLSRLLRPAPVAAPRQYADIVAPWCEDPDIWTTTYLHRLEGPDPVVAWTSGSVLRPFLTALAAAEQTTFLSHYRELVTEAYPPGADGATWLPFTRMFIVVRRRSA